MVFEGYMLRHAGWVWAVKGCYHPEGYAVALPRLVNGVKVKTLKEGMRLVRERFPQYLRFVEEIGFEVPLVPLKESEVLNPFEVKPRGVLRDFLTFFKDAGVTGSYLYAGNGTDMDVLSLSEENVETLRNLRRAGLTSPLFHYSKGEVEGLLETDFATLKAYRLTEGTYIGIPYTFKIVRCEDPSPASGLTRVRGEVVITQSVKPYSLPLKYLGRLDGEEVTVTSYRSRYSELPPGTKLYVEGTVIRRREFLDLDLDLAEEVRILELGSWSELSLSSSQV